MLGEADRSQVQGGAALTNSGLLVNIARQRELELLDRQRRRRAHRGKEHLARLEASQAISVEEEFRRNGRWHIQFLHSKH